MIIRPIAFVFFGLFCTAASAADSMPVRTDTPSGYPVPRFVSLKYNKTNCRVGPSKSHQIRYTFVRRGAPLLVIAETHDHWRKVRDRDGDECWAHKTVLRSPSHAFSTAELDLLTRPKSDAEVRGRISQDVLVKIERSKKDWIRVSVGELGGWVRRNALWGIDIEDAATHN